ncbi:hypothetical protein [Erythrobacter ani]|uniref:Uncharacterized protein n=1 Tax=Erythrobacter ani TaxID=2827235 RepID=A0ABS6SJU8_9SPHN|nr:hypothetical protein [Erythrobacter ani]MBV7265146.1 hypothetical protein [Erythrobacter ani]
MANRSKSIAVFATNSDWLKVFEDVQHKMPTKVVLAGRQDGPLQIFEDLEEIQGFGSAKSGAEVTESSYLWLKKKQRPKTRLVEQRKGDAVEIIDQLSVPNSVTVCFGGIFSERTLISGSVGTASAAMEALDLYALIKKKIRANFAIVNSNYVGPTASKLLNDGWRLTADDRAPQEYDLKPQ